MNSQFAADINDWFNSHVDTILPDTVRTFPEIESKLEHIKNVISYCRILGKNLDWSENNIQIAETIGLLHDVGRFTQFIKYHTIIDADSVNHAKLAFSIVNKSGILAPLPFPDRTIILEGIRYHNDKKFGNKVHPESLPFIKLIRDADKLDKLRVAKVAVQEHLNNSPNLQLTLFTDGTVNPKALSQLKRCQTVSKKYIRSELDFRLLQLSLIFDIQYAVTYRIIAESNIVGQLIAILPDEKEIRKTVNKVTKFFNEKIS
ncbi:MAG: HD domain-containing protein [Candidatus Latescibacteria bacterium]|nr:HD domain-containing protein [Candidatus Latescibacterota bacterium]